MKKVDFIEFDFSDENVLGKLEKMRNDFPPEHVFHTAIKFSIDWLGGVEEFEFTTSGSTGIPKKMRVERGRIVASIEGTARFFDLKRSETALLCLDPKYSGGKMMLARATHVGMKIKIIAPTNMALSMFINEKFDIVSVVPSQLYALFQQDFPENYLSNYKNMIVGGAAVPKSLVEKLQNVEDISVFESFGMTETLSHFALKKINGRSSEDFFTLLPNVEIKTNDKGCLMVKAPMTDNKWLESNDIVEIKNEKYFKYIGRFDNVINSGGVKIFPEQMEDKIASILHHVGFYGDFFLTAMTDEKLGQKMVLVLENADEINGVSLLQTLKEELPKFHAPIEIIKMKNFNRTASGKVIRKV